MKTGNNKSTNNYIVAFWSSHYYHEKHTKRDNIFHGQIRNPRTKEVKFFNNVAELLTIKQKWYKEDEKWRKRTNQKRCEDEDKEERKNEN